MSIRASCCRAGVAVLVLVLGSGSLAHGQTVRNLTNLAEEGLRGWAVDDAGSVVYGVSSSNQFGTNPLHIPQIFRWDPVTGTGTQVTSFEKGVEAVSVSDDGAWLAFISYSDLLGSNHDGGGELYVMRSDGTGIVQLTSDSSGDAAVKSAAIAGSGNRVVFQASTDPLGSNPGHALQVFVVERDGTSLVQLTNSLSILDAPSISDDGTRIVFTTMEDLTGENPGGEQVFAVLGDGTGLRQVTHFTNEYYVSAPKLSGDGSRIAFARGGCIDGFIDKVEWDGTGLVELGPGCQPSITDDGQTIVYGYNGQIWRIGADGTGNTQLASGSGPVISGNGSRVVYSGSGGLIAIDSSGGNLRQLTQSVPGQGARGTSAITLDGSRVFFALSSAAGVNVYRVQSDGSQLTQLTDQAFDVYQVAPSPDGNVVAFSTSSVRIYKVQADGTGLLELTQGHNAFSANPVITSDGNWVIFESSGLFPGCCGFEIYRVHLDGSALFNVTAENDPNGGSAKKPRVSDNTPLPWIVYQSRSDYDGQNPDGSLEILRIRLNGTARQRLTADPIYDSIVPDISGNGNLVVYTSEADPLGTNPEHNDEIFLYDIPAASRRQLTFTPLGVSYKPIITRDGGYVYFISSAPFFEPNLDGHFEPYRVSVATGVVERLGGTRCCNAYVDTFFPYYEDPREWLLVSPDRTGSRAVFTGWGGWSDQNPDRGGDAFLVDFQAKPKLAVGKSAPTLLTWDPEPKPRRYDVIRGDVASLRPGAPGVDLGVVACIENDSPDASTAGSGDAAQPSPGQAFFYLHRGSQGIYDGPGSWGVGSGNQQRVAGPGSCSP